MNSYTNKRHWEMLTLRANRAIRWSRYNNTAAVKYTTEKKANTSAISSVLVHKASTTRWKIEVCCWDFMWALRNGRWVL